MNICSVETEQFDRARKYAADKDLDIDSALVALQIADYPELGQCLSRMYNLPYAPLLYEPPGDHARHLLSAKCSAEWKVFPVSYDPAKNILTVAVHDPDQIPRLKNVHSLFMQPHSMAFTVASQAEILKALEMHFSPESEEKEKGPAREKNGKQKLASLHKHMETNQSAGASSRTTRPGPAVAPSRPAPQRQHPTAESAEPSRLRSELKVTYSEMSRALVSTVAMLVRTNLEDNRELMDELRSSVRYCQLVASRLNLSPPQTDGLVLAAWLSAFQNKPDMVKIILAPYKLDYLVSPDSALQYPDRVETAILSLVKSYHAFKRSDPPGSKDVSLTRRHLRTAWSSSTERQDILETFLQVLMDEEFLAKLDRAAGRILIVDPAEISRATIAPPLTSDGYEVAVAADADEARTLIAQSTPDLIITEVSLPDQSGLKFCQEINKASKTSHLPVIVVAEHGGEKQAAACLRAGADDFLAKPIDLELLFLKIQRLLSKLDSAPAKAGVSGSLDDMSFTDMIQIICAGAKSMQILLTHGDREGVVLVENGEIVHAQTGDKKGEEAFYDMMRWREGDFTTTQCGEFPEKTIQSSAMSLLMEGARLADENKDGN